MFIFTFSLKRRPKAFCKCRKFHNKIIGTVAGGFVGVYSSFLLKVNGSIGQE